MKSSRNLRDIFKKKTYYKTREKDDSNKLINNKNIKSKRDIKIKKELFDNKIKNRNRKFFSFIFVKMRIENRLK